MSQRLLSNRTQEYIFEDMILQLFVSLFPSKHVSIQVPRRHKEYVSYASAALICF